MCPEACRARPVREPVRTSDSIQQRPLPRSKLPGLGSGSSMRTLLRPGKPTRRLEKDETRSWRPGKQAGRTDRNKLRVPQSDYLSGPGSGIPIELPQSRRRTAAVDRYRERRCRGSRGRKHGRVAKPAAAQSVWILRRARAAPEFRRRPTTGQKFGLRWMTRVGAVELK